VDVDCSVGVVPSGDDEVIAIVFEALVGRSGKELADVNSQHT